MRLSGKLILSLTACLCLGAALLAAADTFQENFTSTTFKDADLTSADWDTGAVPPATHLSAAYTFSQPSGPVIWGGQINAIGQAGGTWLIGGNKAKIDKYDGSTFTDLSNQLDNFQGTNIKAAAYSSDWGYWFVGGESGRLNKYDGSTFTDQSAGLAWSTNNIYAIAPGSNSGSENFWLIGGGAGSVGKLSKYNGTSFSTVNGNNWLGAYGNTLPINAIAFNGTYWLIGGSNGSLARYQGGAFTNLTSSLNWSGAVYAITWDGTRWLIGGSGTKQVVAYDGSTFTNYSTLVTINQVNAIAHNGTYWMFVGQGTGSAAVAYSWDGSTFTDLSGYLANMSGSNVPLYAVAGNGTEWLLGGTQAKLNRHTGGASSTTFADRSN
ncbi:MAG: hypothetical protein HGA76_09510, partial [Candidatus Firestonebacteria bacterium]|nr:hypothetical protein [Candidatus Firestonebacteria bacterium]